MASTTRRCSGRIWPPRRFWASRSRRLRRTVKHWLPRPELDPSPGVLTIAQAGGLRGMIDAVVKTLTQMFTPPFRRVLLKSIGLALVMIVLLGVGMYHVFAWLAQAGTGWAESNVGAVPHTAWTVLAWILSFM